MVVAATSGAPNQDTQVTTIVPRPSSRSGDRNPREPILEIKQKTSSKHEKRTRRDFYRHSGDDKTAPIEYVYTYSEETPRASDGDGPADGATSTDLVPVNGSGAAAVGKIECTVGDDGNLVVKIRGKPDKVPLDPRNLPVTLPDGWELREIQTNQRSRRTERSRKLRIKDEQVIEEQTSGAITVYDDLTVALNGSADHSTTVGEEREYGHADDEEYEQGQRNGVAFVSKKSKKFTQGAAGLTSKMEELRTEEGVNIDHPDHQQRYSRNLRSTSERTESNQRKFTKQSVTDEKVTETHKSQVMYFDADAADSTTRHHRVDAHSTVYNGRSDVQRRDENRQENGGIVESPDDSPYHTLDRKHHEDIEIIQDDKQTTGRHKGKTTTFENRRGYYTERDRTDQDYHDSAEDTQTDQRQFRGTATPKPDGEERRLRRDHKGNIVEEKVIEEEYRRGRDSRQSDFDSEVTERIEERRDLQETYQKPHPDHSTDRVDHFEEADQYYRSHPVHKESDYDSVYNESTRESTSDFYSPHQVNGTRKSHTEDIEKTVVEDYYRLHPTPHSETTTDQKTEQTVRTGTNLTPSRSIQKHHTETSVEEETYGAYPSAARETVDERVETTDVTKYRSPVENLEENVETTNVEEYYRVAPKSRKLFDTKTDDEQSETRTIVQTDLVTYPPGKRENLEKNVEKTTVEDYYRIHPSPKQTHRETREEKFDKIEKSRFAPYSPQRTDRIDENVEKTTVEDYYRVHPVPKQTHTETREEKFEKLDKSRFAPYSPQRTDQIDENVEKTIVEDHYRIHPAPKQSHTETREEKLERLEKSLHVPYSPPRTDRLDENIEKTVVEDLYRVHPAPKKTHTETREEKFQKLEKSRFAPYSPQRTDQIDENVEKTTIEEQYRVRPVPKQTHTEVREERVEQLSKHHSVPYPSQRRDHSEENIEETVAEEHYRIPQENRSEINEKYARIEKRHSPQQTGHTDETTEKTIIEDYYRAHPRPDTHQTTTETREGSTTLKSIPAASKHDTRSETRVETVKIIQPPVAPRESFTENVQTTNIEEYHRLQPRQRPVRENQETVKETVVESYYDAPSTRKMVGTEISVAMVDGKSPTPGQERRSKERVTIQEERNSVQERIIPVGLPTDVHGRSSRSSSVDLSDIKPGEQLLDNRILRDRGNLAQGGSMGLRRPPSRNPVKQHLGDENAPDDVMSTSDITLPTNMTQSHFTRQQTQTSKTRTTSVKQQQQVTRDQQVLLNYVDTSRKPDWVHNIDQHFAGRTNVQYVRPSPKSPTPRIEEIVTVPNGSTLITVSGEQEAVHGIVTEPTDRPFPVAVPDETTLVHHSDKASRTGFTRVTDAAGYRKAASEKVTYQETRENQRQITISYDLPGVGKETREYTWEGAQERPTEKIMFEETRERSQDVSLTLGMEQTRTTTQTMEKEEKFIFDEIREAPRRDVSVKLAIDTQREVAVTRTPAQPEMFHFDEEIKREHDVNFVIGLQQEQPRKSTAERTEIYERKEIREDIYRQPVETMRFREDREVTRDVSVTMGIQPEVEKVTFHEDREITRDVSLTLGIEPLAPVEPLPIEKITFEETRVVPAEVPVAVTFGLEEPLRFPPRPVSVVSDTTIITPEIVPKYSRTVKEEKKEEVRRTILEPVPEYQHYEEDSRIEDYRIITPSPAPLREETVTRVREDVREVQKYERHEPVPEYTQQYAEDLRVDEYRQFITSSPAPLREETVTQVREDVRVMQQVVQPPVRQHHRYDETVREDVRVMQQVIQPPEHHRYDETVRVREDVRVLQQVVQPPVREHHRYDETVRVREDVKMQQIIQPVPEDRYHYEEDVRVEERQRVVMPPARPHFAHEEKRRVDVLERIVEMRESPPKITAQVAIQTPTLVEVRTEVVPPLPRRTSLTAAINATELHHTEADLVPVPKRIYETTVDYTPHEKRERAEEHVQVKGPPPPKPPPTSGRVEKHVNLETIVPEPTGQPLPHSLGTYGYVYQATLDAKRPEAEKGIEFHVIETPTVVQEERVEKIDWYVKEGAVIEEMSETESSVGEPRAVSPPRHPELTASTEVISPTRVTAAVEVSPPKERPVKRPIEKPVLEEARRRYYFGEDEEDRVSVQETVEKKVTKPKTEVVTQTKVREDLVRGRVEEKKVQTTENIVAAPPPPLKKQINEMIRKIIAEAVPTHHTELGLTTEEEERWKSSLQRTPLRRPQRAEAKLQLKKAPPPPVRLPPVSGRIPKLTGTEHVNPEPTGILLPKVMGTYGFLYIATLEPRLLPPTASTTIYEIPTVIRETEVIREAEMSYIELDVQQVLLAAFSEIHPPLTIRQQEQLLTATAEVFPPLTEGQQQRLLNAMVEIMPPLSPQQQYQLLTGAEEVVPALTMEQQVQLSIATAEIIPTFTVEQQQQVLRASVEIVPPLVPEQQRQLLSAIAEVFPVQRTETDIELELERRPLPTPSHRIPRKTWSGQLELAPTGQRLHKELGTYGFLYVTHVQPPRPAPEHPSHPIEVTIKSIDIDIHQVLLTAIQEIQPPLTTEQEQQLVTTAADIFPSLTVMQQKRLLEVLTEIRPPLSVQQQEMLFLAEEIVPPLTPGQMRQLVIASAEIIRITEQQETLLLRASTRVVPALTSEQQLQLLRGVEELFPTPERVEQLIQLEEDVEIFLPTPTHRPVKHVTTSQHRPSSTLPILHPTGTYGFLYLTHVDHTAKSALRGETIDMRTMDSTYIELDYQQLIRTVAVHTTPPLTAGQTEQLVATSERVFEVLTEEQQERLLRAVSDIVPPLTAQQQVEILSGKEDVTEVLTVEQENQLLLASARIVHITVEQERKLLYSMVNIKPELTAEQKEQVVDSVVGLFPTPEKAERMIRLDELRRSEETTTTHRRNHTSRTEVHPSSATQSPFPSLGIYGFLYSTHVDTAHPLSPSTIQLDTRRAILTAISSIQPSLSTQQTTELFTNAVEVIGTLNINQQRDVMQKLNVLELRDDQVDKLLSGLEIDLTREQKEGLLVSSAETFVLTVEKRHALEYVMGNVQPRLTVSQQKQFMWAISMLFPTLETVQQIIETTRTQEISQDLHRRKHTTQTTITPAATARPQPLSTGIYGYLYTTHVDHHPSRPFRPDTFDTSSIHLDVRKAVLSVLSEIQPPLSPKQVSELFGATVETITELNTIQQKQAMNVLSRVTPALTDRQIQQILKGETVVPELTDEQREGLLIGSAEVFAVSGEQEEALEYIAVNVQPKLNKEQQRQYVRAITLLFPTLQRVHEMIQIDRSRRFASHTFTMPVSAPQPAALGVYGFLYTTRVAPGPFSPETFDHSTIQLDIRKAVLSALSDIQPALSTNQITELFNATVEVFSELTVTQQKQILNVLSLITPELTANQMQQILTGTKVMPALLEEQRELLLIASAEILSITEEQERALEYIATNVYPQLTPGQRQQYKRAVSMLFPTLEKVMEILKLDRIPTPFGRRTPRARSADKKHRPAMPQLSRALGVYGYLYMAHVDSLSLSTNRPVSISTIDFRTIELDAKKAVLNVIDEIQPALSVQQEDELFNAAVKLIPVLEEHQQQKLLKALFEVQPPLSPLQLHQLLGGNDISPPLSGRQQEQLLRASAGIVSMSVRDELELVQVVENVYPPLSVSQQQQFLSGINRLFPAPSKITQILQELQATAYQPKALGTFGFLYITHVKRDETAEFQSLDINLRDVDVSSIELDIEHAMLAAFADIQPPLTHKQQHQLLIASRDIFPRLTEQQQKRILNVLVQLLPPMTVRQQRQLLTGSDLVIPPLTTRQQQQLLAASSEIFTLTAKLEKQLIYATTQVSPPLTPEQQRHFLTALREIFPASKKSQTETMIERFEQSTRGSRMSRLEEHESYGRINEKGIWERTGSEQRRDRVYRDASIFDAPDHPHRPTDYEGPHPDWVDDTRHLQVGTQERHVGHVDFAELAESVRRRRSLNQRLLGYKDSGLDSSSDSSFPEEQPALYPTTFQGVYTYDERERVGAYMGLLHKNDFDEKFSSKDDSEEEEFQFTNKLDPGRSRGLSKTLPGSRFPSPFGFKGNTGKLNPQWESVILEARLRKLKRIRWENRRKTARASLSPTSMARIRKEEAMGDRSYLPSLDPKDKKKSKPKPAKKKVVIAEAPPPPVPEPETPKPEPKPPTPPAEPKVLDRRLALLSPDIFSGGELDDDLFGSPSGQFVPEPVEEIKVTKPAKRRSTAVSGASSGRRLTLQEMQARLGGNDGKDDTLDLMRVFKVGTMERGGILKDKEVMLPDEKKWLAEQHMAIDEEFTDLEVSAISMNVKPRIKSQMYMDPSPPTARTFSPATGGFQYSASPQHPSPPMTEYSGFVYEAQVDGHHSPMSAEMGRYGFTYHTTLDGSELHRKAHEHAEPLHMYAESRKRSPPESIKAMSATPPWSTPPVTPTPVMATSAGHSRENTPLLAVKELPELSRDSRWKKPDSPEKLRSSMEKDIYKDTQYPEQIFRLKKDERQEVTGLVSSPQQEVYERITETTARVRQEREITERRDGSMFQDVSGRRPSDEGVFREFEKAASELEHNISGRHGAASRQPVGYEKETTVTQKTSESQRSYSETSEGRRRVTSVAVPSRTVPAHTTDEDDSRPEWVRIAEQKKSSMYAREVPVKRHLGNLPEETPLEAALERAIEKNNQRRSQAETSPLRKWDTLQLSADSLAQNEKEELRGYKRHETQTKETIEESRFHSEQAMRDSTNSGSPPNLAAYASMSQSLPSLSGRRSAGSAAGYGQLKRKDLGDVVSLEELQKSSRTLKRTDGAEEETRDTSLIRRGDDVSPETKRTKRTVVRKLINGQWREVAVKEEDVPVESDLLMQIEESPDKILDKFKKDDDTWSLSDAIIEETTTTRTVRRVEEEEEDVISLADSERSAPRQC